jgi:hypothetical protein
MFSVAIWVVVSVLSVISLLGFFLVYRKLSSVQHQLIVLNEGTASFAPLKDIPPLLKELQGALADVKTDSRDIQRSTSNALGKIADNALNSWATFEKAISFLTADAKNVATTIQNGNNSLAETLRGYDHVLKSLKSNDDFMESQANTLRTEGIAMRASADRIVQDVPQAIASVVQSLDTGFHEIRARAINDQLTVYPRKLFIELDERETYVELVEQQYGLWRMPCKSDGNLKFRLVCESDQCLNEKGTYKSQFVYELREPARIDCTYLPRAGDVEAFFDLADVTSMTDHLEKVGEGLLAVKLGLTFGSLAHPVFAIAVIALEAGLEDLVKNLQTDFRDRRATKQLWELVRRAPYQIKDIGGPGHTQFGDFIRRKEESGGAHLQKSFGGLSKWMNPETHTFAWVCPTDAYNLIAKYRSDPRLPRAGDAAA